MILSYLRKLWWLWLSLSYQMGIQTVDFNHLNLKLHLHYSQSWMDLLEWFCLLMILLSQQLDPMFGLLALMNLKSLKNLSLKMRLAQIVILSLLKN